MYIYDLPTGMHIHIYETMVAFHFANAVNQRPGGEEPLCRGIGIFGEEVRCSRANKNGGDRGDMTAERKNGAIIVIVHIYIYML